MNCAFQWAQHPNFIYLNVKFSGRIDGPVTVLNVDNENVTLTNESFHFSALGRQKPKTFQLHLQLDRAIVPENSTWAFASVGRISFTLAKAEAGAWPRCSRRTRRSRRTCTWYERRQSLDAQVKREKKEREEREEKEREEKEKKEKAAEAKAKKAAAPPPSPPADGGDADGGDAPPAPPVDSEEGGAPTPPSEGKKKKKGKKKKAAKDEV